MHECSVRVLLEVSVTSACYCVHGEWMWRPGTWMSHGETAVWRRGHGEQCVTHVIAVVSAEYWQQRVDHLTLHTSINCSAHCSSSYLPSSACNLYCSELVSNHSTQLTTIKQN